jgi:exosome complex exonuclease RRP6
MEDPKTIKVMHGADMDTKWLQRDFNIHIHNLFDTYRAARVLGMQKLSYAFLLTHYCNVSTDKTYQTADWRQRPLPQEMLHYARLDTHYLLEIFDRLRADLHQKALSMGLNPHSVFADVYSSSHEVTKNEVELFDFKNKDCLQNLHK